MKHPCPLPNRSDQATRLRELAGKRLPAMTLAVTSGKGGVGKSNIAVNLAVYLSGRGFKVILIDVDLGLANADLLMNIQPRYTLSHVLAGVRTLEEICVEGPCGIRFIPGASGFPELADLAEFERQNLIAQFQRLEDSADIVVLDCGAGISRNVMGFAAAADHILVITTPEPPALTDAYATIKALQRLQYAARVGLVVNRAASRDEARGTYKRIADVSQRFLNYYVADNGYLLHDTHVELAVHQRCPFVISFPDSNASACLAAVANTVSQPARAAKQQGSFFRRVAGLFV